MKNKLPILFLLGLIVLAGCTPNPSSSDSNSAPQSSQSESSSEATSPSSSTSSGGSTSTSTSGSENSSSEPGSSDPGTSQPGSSEPGSSEPGSSEPGSSEPGSSEPGTSDPGTSDPGTSDPDPDPEIPEPGLLGTWKGINEAEVSLGHYFNVFEHVSLTSSDGIDLSSYIEVLGFVDYGKIGEYDLTYKASYKGVVDTKYRRVNVTNKTFVPPVKTKVEGADRTVNLGSGSYRTGKAGNDSVNNFSRPMYAPVFMDAHLQDKPIPTNGWWTTLISQNYGGGNFAGGGNGIYLNPLRSALGSTGIEISDVGEGWTQYNLAGEARNEKTAATFSTFFQDLLIKPSSLNASYVSMVNAYTDNNVKVALRNDKNGLDEAVVTYTQGSPYVFMEFREKETIRIDLVTGGVSGGYNFYNTNGTRITGDNFTGDSFIVELNQRHYGYGSYPYHNPGIGAPLYKNSFFIVNLPGGSSATFKHGTHSNVTMKNRIDITLGSGNFMSVATMNSASEGAFYHKHGYAFMDTSTVSHSVDRATNIATAVFRNNLHHVVESASSGVLAVMPHQQKISSGPYSSYVMKTVRGTLKMLESNTLITNAQFSGVLPSFTLPTNNSFNQANMKAYLQDLDARNVPDGIDNSPKNVGPREKDLVDNRAPYWNAKALYPLAQATIMADQMGETALRDSFLAKIKHSLTDWFTYSGPSDPRYIFHDEVWGTTYYSHNEFNTGAELSDHHFTHAYFVYASAIVGMYDKVFYNQYKDIITFFLSDYASSEENSHYPVLRQFDDWAGHSWAHGFGFFTEGNNQESSGEALNGWVAAYLIGQQNQDDDLIDAAVYGYANELNAIKTYWFDYDKNVFNSNYGSFTEVAGIVFGGKYDYATWFGANPTFIYGIHWLPIGEYNTSYALGSAQRARFTQIFNKYWEMSGGPNTWYSNIWVMKSIVNSSGALSDFNAAKITADEYPNELPLAYYMINALDALGTHSLATYAQVNGATSSSVYETADGGLVAMVWNPTNTSQTVTFKTGNNVIKTVTVAANSFTKHVL